MLTRLSMCTLLVAFLSVGCIPGEPNARIGVSKTETGKIEVVYDLCPGQSVTSALLIVPEDGFIDYEKDDVLWKVESKAASKRERFIVGDTPEGFAERVALEELPADRQIAAAVLGPDNLELTISFTLGDLRVGNVLHFGRYVDATQFEEFLVSERPC